VNTALESIQQTAVAAGALKNPLAAVEALQPTATLAEVVTALRTVVAEVVGLDALEVAVTREACTRKLKDLGSIDAPSRLVDAAFASLSKTQNRVERRAPAIAATSPAAGDLPDDWYDAGRKEYLVRTTSGEWQRYTESQYRRILRARGLSAEPSKTENVSEVDRVIVEIQDKHAVSYAGRLAGWPAGVHDVAGGHILVTQSQKLIDAKPGDWQPLRTFIESLLGNSQGQILVFYGWLKVALEALYSRQFRPGQALVLAGPHNCGKSLLQQVLTVLFGGFFGRPYAYMSGQTAHNQDLFEAVHQIVEDDVASTRLDDRRKFGAKIKEITANRGQRCHPKFVDAMILDPFWRISISVNMEAENLMILPPLDESLTDKMIIFKAGRATLPCETCAPEDYKRCLTMLVDELPAFVAFLQAWQIPDELRSGRYGVREYHHPDLVQALNALAPESKLAEIIDGIMFKTNGAAKEWRGRASELERELRADEDYGAEAGRLFSFNTACGVYLSRLGKKDGRRYHCDHHADGNTWVIQPPKWPLVPGGASG